MQEAKAPIRQNILEALKSSKLTEPLAGGLEKGDPFTITISPDIADTLLAVTNTFNRVPAPAKIKSYVRAMLAQEWQYNGDPIRFYMDDYKLADGQHRLHAISQSKLEQKCLIVPGIAHEAYLTIDTGKNRTPRDAFMMLNHENPNDKATCCLLSLKWMTAKQIRNTTAPSTTQILAFEKTHSLAISEAVRYVVSLQNEYGRKIAPGNLAAVIVIDYLNRGSLDENLLAFCEQFWSNAYGEKDTPIYQLIRLLERHEGAKTIKQGKLNTEMLLGSVLRAWKLTRNSKIATTFNDVMYPARKNEPFSSVL